MPHLFSHHHHEGDSASHGTDSQHRNSSSHNSGTHSNPQTHTSTTTRPPPLTASHEQEANTNPLHAQYRDALPSRLDAKFHGQPVTGTAIIVDELPEFMRNESEFELVTPQRTTALEAFAEVKYSGPQAESPASETSSNGSAITPSALSQEGESGVYSSHGSGSVDSKHHRKGHMSSKKRKEAEAKEAKRREQLERHPHQVLNDGGYIIFSDKYLAAHPESRVASATHRYSAANPAPQTKPEIDPELPEEKQNTEKAKFLIEQSEGDYRPLFRKRASDLVYGRAEYEPSEQTDSDTFATRSSDATPGPGVAATVTRNA